MKRLVWLLATASSGCGAIQVGGALFGEGTFWMRPPEPIAAAHPFEGPPLSGYALSGSRRLLSAGSSRCTLTPLEQVRVEVTRATICVHNNALFLSDPSGALPIPWLRAQAATSNGGERQIRLEPEGPLLKIGGCVGIDPVQTAVWQRAYVSCFPNEGFVDPDTTWFSISAPGSLLSISYERIRWVFDRSPSQAIRQSTPSAKVDDGARPSASAARSIKAVG